MFARTTAIRDKMMALLTVEILLLSKNNNHIWTLSYSFRFWNIIFNSSLTSLLVVFQLIKWGRECRRDIKYNEKIKTFDHIVGKELEQFVEDSTKGYYGSKYFLGNFYIYRKRK